MLRWLTISKLLLSASHVNLPTWTSQNLVPLLSKPIHFSFKFIISTLIEKIIIPRPLSQATTYNDPNIFTFTLPLSEGQASEAWEHYDENYDETMLFFFPHKKVPLTFPLTSYFHLSSATLSPSPSHFHLLSLFSMERHCVACEVWNVFPFILYTWTWGSEVRLSALSVPADQIRGADQFLQTCWVGTSNVLWVAWVQRVWENLNSPRGEAIPTGTSNTHIVHKKELKTKRTNSIAWVRKRTITTERQPLVGEFRVNVLWIESETWSARRIPTAVF
jgi:hypothetical protein